MKQVILIVALLAAGGLLGCREERRADSTISADVRRELVVAKVPGNITVDVARGVVVLNGTVPTDDAHDRAEDVAEEVKGVDRVTNNLRIMAGDAPAGAIPPRPMAPAPGAVPPAPEPPAAIQPDVAPANRDYR
jgi:hypothetical protein